VGVRCGDADGHDVPLQMVVTIYMVLGVIYMIARPAWVSI
jgi:hypothetical protein